MVVEPGDRLGPLEAVEEVPAQGGDRRGPLGGHPGGLPLVVGDPVQDQVLPGREVPEERRLGDLGGGRDLGDGHGVEAPLQEQPDGGLGDVPVHPLPLALTQTDLAHATSLTSAA